MSSCARTESNLSSTGSGAPARLRRLLILGRLLDCCCTSPTYLKHPMITGLRDASPPLVKPRYAPITCAMQHLSRSKPRSARRWLTRRFVRKGGKGSVSSVVNDKTVLSCMIRSMLGRG